MNMPQLLSVFTALTVLLPAPVLAATQVQLHYDPGDEREYFTTTVEMFKPDTYGSTFFFVDMNYDAGDVEGVSEAYWEIARTINSPCGRPVGLHLEYNGGLGQFSTPEGHAAYTINDAWLAGTEFYWNAEDFSKGATLQLLYKNIRDKHDDAYQITLVWYWHLLDRAVTFRGFADFWREDSDFNFDGDADADHIFLSEPQLWYNINPTLSVGTEVEFGYNFAGFEGWEINPTVAAKVTF